VTAAFLMRLDIFELVYGPEVRDRFPEAPIGFEPPSETEVLFASWGAPALDEDRLARLPNLKLVLYGAGMPALATDAFWATGIPLCTAKSANAIPVSEYVLGAILLSLKGFWACQRITASGVWAKPTHRRPGLLGSTVGLIGLGEIGRLVRARLEAHELRVRTYDPFCPDQANTDSLEELFAQSDVVSLHAPNVPANRGLITESLLASLPEGATFLNTARGALVDEEAMARVAAARPDLTFLLDVTDPEPPAADSPLFRLPNVVMTPHIAGCEGAECRRMGRLMVEEHDRFVRGEPLLHRYPAEQRAHLA